MTSVALQQVSSKFARENAARTLEKPIGLKFISRHLTPSLLSRLETSCPDGRIYVWGAKLERSHQAHKMPTRDALILFRRGATVYKYGVVLEKETNEPLAEALWGRDIDGETWANISFFARIKDKRIPAARINKALGRSEKDNWQGLVAIPLAESERLSAFFERQLDGL